MFQISRAYDGDAYRAVHVAKFKEATYILRAFQKAKSGSKTDKGNIDAVETALESAEEHYKANCEKGDER